MEIIQRFIVTLQLKNGNLIYVNTGRLMNDGHNETGMGERKLIWDEENRLLAVDDNGFVSNYWYDADGERTVKTSGESDQVYVNGVFSGGSTNTAKFSLYVSPYLVANQGGRYTKHIYAGSQRIVSKVGDFASYGSDPRRIEYAGANTDGLSVDYKAKYAAQQQVIKDNYKFIDVPYNGTDNDNYADGEGFCCNDGSMEAAVARTKAQARAVAKSFKDPDNYENLQFFYHPDHLGNSSFITNLEGEVVQHIEYVPFGEVFIEERNNVWNTPYLFNAKEFDEETGMYYYGARYYEPRLSLWMSTDPMQEHRLDFSSYSYCLQNPIILVDPDGKREWPVNKYNGKTYRHENNYHQNRGVRKDGSVRYHQGVDINIGAGSDDLGAPVYATHDGIVVRVQRYTDDKDAGGTRIKIQSEDGKVATYYMHLKDISEGIELNAMVSEGQQIGTIGGSGSGKEMKYVPHLHYELFIDGKHSDPTTSREHLVDPQLLLGGSSDNNIYEGGTLKEVTIYGKRSQQKMHLDVPPIEITVPSSLPKIESND